MEHLTPLDTAFLELEDGHAALHIASVAVFTGEPLTDAEFRKLFARRLHLVPRLRQRLQPVPLGIGRPAWVDDADFDLDYHLRRTALATPGDLRCLDELMGRLMSTRLDPERPMWEAWVVEGVAGGRWALVTKMHHSMVDGMSGMALITTLLDRTPRTSLPPVDRWVPADPPSAAALAVSALRAQAHEARATLRVAARAATRPRTAVRRSRAIASGLTALRAGLRSTARSSLAGNLHSPRAYRAGSIALADLDVVRRSLGGTTNDVVLALVTGALRDVLAERHERPRAHQVHCLVPVSLRRSGNPIEPVAGNVVSALIVDLPVEYHDPLVRYRVLLARVRRAKAAHEAEAGGMIAAVLTALPVPLVTVGVRIAARLPQHFLTTVVTNVPGPAHSLYAFGRPMVEHYPYVPIANRVRIGVAVTSYGDRLWYGITADRDSVPDVDAVPAALDEQLQTMLATTHRAAAR